jgi:DNA-binding response OmpR family regulator
VVDDDRSLRVLVARLLAHYGASAVLEAADGASALMLLRATPVDGIVLDLLMPEPDGVTLLKMLRSDPRFADLPVCVLSAVGDREAVQEVMTLGVSAYMLKPFNPVQAGRRLHAFVDQCRAHAAAQGHSSISA